MSERYTRGLNKQQTEAVLHKSGPLLIVAGAGTGKTRTLTHRIAALIESGVEPYKVLAVTFTNKAAAEMRERIFDLIGHATSTMPMMRTFHSLGVFILRNNYQKIGIKKSFSILSQQDVRRMIKRGLDEFSLDAKVYDPKLIQKVISKHKNNLLELEDYDVSSAFGSNLLKVWRWFEAEKRRSHAVDFDDLLSLTYKLLYENSDVREYYQNLWEYIHIDEYQDTNNVQHNIIKFLCNKQMNLCVVGDSDQNIYSWRGAQLKNILNFDKDFAGSKTIILEDNYRSTANIIVAAQAVIEKNNNRIHKVLKAKKDEGEKIRIVGHFSGVSEARYVASKIKDLIKSKVNPNEIAVLYRANFLSRIIEEAMLRSNIQYQVIGTKFFERAEVRDMVAYLRASQNPESLADLARILNTPKRGLGKVSVLKILAHDIEGLSAKAKASYFDVMNILQKIRDFSKQNSPAQIVSFAIKISGLEDALGRGTSEDKERLENLKELVTYASKYDSYTDGDAFEKMMEDIALMSDQDEMNGKNEHPTVKLMTVHASKGLEFEYVFMVGMEKGIFPSERDDNDRDNEEERRLCYVAMTRAKDKLFMTYAEGRKIFGNDIQQTPSLFLEDIPIELVEGSDDNFENQDGENIIYLEW